MKMTSPNTRGRPARVKISQIPVIVWEKTEAGEFAKGPRFRPVYYLLRLTETALWGGEGAYWYGFRIFLFGIVIEGLWWLCVQAAGPIFGSNWRRRADRSARARRLASWRAGQGQVFGVAICGSPKLSMNLT